MRVVCTAGHVDHGKSTLVRALTGMEPDRLEEERRRGLTIDLGFAWADFGKPGVGERVIAFVDLPGHERFVPTMLAGAGALDTALFVVAADEGWMPQSAEHLAILDLLGVSNGVVALTKIDSVDEETVEVARELVREQLEGTAFASVQLIGVSAATRTGLDELQAALLDTLDAAPPPPDHGRPRLWVDRSFSIRGAGTVVTGTLTGGHLRTGEQLQVLPGGPVGRVRGLQSLQRQIEEATPGSRVAVNLSGVERSAVSRGQALGRPGDWPAVDVLEAEVRALPGMAIGRKGAWHLHAGSGERVARITPVGSAPVTQRGHVRIELDAPLPLTAGDRFVLRDSGRRATAGGGMVLDAAPGRRWRGRAAAHRRAAALAARSAALGAGDQARLLILHVQERGAAALPAAAAAVGLTADAVGDVAQRNHLLVLSDGGTAHLVDPAAADRWAAAVDEALRAYHAAEPLRRVAPRDVAVRAATAAGCPGELAPALLDALAAQGRIAADGPGVRLPSHRVELDERQARVRDTLLAALAGDPFSPPGLEAAAAAAGASPALVRELEADGALVRLGPDLAVVADALDQAVERLAKAAAEEGPLTAARAKEVLGTSRKYALPLLEELDRRGRTRRRGDVREVVG